jgi:tRNA-specific 2-thiouridylase
MIAEKNKKKVGVLMSGGVDSSVAALLLKKSGYEIVGFHLKISQFCNPQDELDARLVAQKLNFPIYTLDISQDYQRLIALETIKEYAVGRTPNPDVLCNSQIKFGLILDFLKDLNINYLATGHYAKIIQWQKFKFIAQPKDTSKDQTYFLWQIKRRYLKKILFPLDDYLKSEIRQLAADNNFPNAYKKDSQGICFLGKIKLVDFLKNFLPSRKGLIVDRQGRILGYHPGYYFFTEGQRHGLNIKIGQGPYYVEIKNPHKNVLVVSRFEEALIFNKIKLRNINFLIEPAILKGLIKNNELKVKVRCRYRQPLIAAIFNLKEKTILFSQPLRYIALGQSAVFYLDGQQISPSLQGELILGGGGIIAQKFNNDD